MSMNRIFSSPFVHSVYYFRDVFDPAHSSETEKVEGMLLHEYGFGDRIHHQDFAFNEGVNCSSVANGTLMRLNACSLMKLHHFCVYPTDNLTKRVAQYAFFILFSTSAATIDLITNISLSIFKLSVWPILRIALRNDELAKRCLNQNIHWHAAATLSSLQDIASTFFQSIFCIFLGPIKARQVDWAYSFGRYEEEMKPPSSTDILLDHFDLASRNGVSDYTLMNREYGPWFERSVHERMLDPQKVRYLREFCGWGKVTDQQLKDTQFSLRDFKDTKMVYRVNLNDFTLILKGEYSVKEDRTLHMYHFIRSKSIPIPPSTELAAG